MKGNHTNFQDQFYFNGHDDSFSRVLFSHKVQDFLVNHHVIYNLLPKNKTTLVRKNAIKMKHSVLKNQNF